MLYSLYNIFNAKSFKAEQANSQQMPNWKKIIERWIRTGKIDCPIPGDKLLQVLLSEWGVELKKITGSHAQVKRIVHEKEFNSTIVINRELATHESRSILRDLRLI